MEDIFEIRTRKNEKLKVDGSFQKCVTFGFFKGDTVETTKGEAIGTNFCLYITNYLVLGVERGRLWVNIKGDIGASFWNHGVDYTVRS